MEATDKNETIRTSFSSNGEVHCPKCSQLLYGYFKESLHLDVKLDQDPQTRQMNFRISSNTKLECPKCNYSLKSLVSLTTDSDHASAKIEAQGNQPHHAKEFLEWGPKLELGVEEIDRQHHKLVGIINRLHVAVTKGQREAKFVPSIIAELMAYAIEHFEAEEKLQINSHYFGLGAHQEEHGAFIDKIGALEMTMKTGIVDLVPVLKFVKDWFIEHTQGSDKAFVAHLLEK